MIPQLLFFIKSQRLALISVLLCIFYLAITLPAFWQSSHLLYNLEPYPDGLLYALSARNFILEGDLALNYQDSHTDFWVAPLYSYVLAIGYLLSQTPQIFYLVNILLGLLSLVALFILTWKTTHSSIAVFITSVIYLAHSYILWLPTIPMAENLSLLLLISSLAFLLIPEKQSWKSFSFLMLSAIGLVLTKYATAVLALALIVLGIIQFRHNYTKPFFLISVSAMLFAFFSFSILITSPFNLLQSFVSALISGTNSYYSFSFFFSNLSSYLNTLVGSNGTFLWQTTPLSSIWILIVFLISLATLWMKKIQYRWKIFILASIFVAQFPLMLIFYVVDARYIIFSIPIFAIGIGWLAAFAWERSYRFSVFLVLGLLLVAHMLTQQPLLRQIVADNVLGRSTAWQHEAILHFDQTIPQSTKETFLITALPPHLIDAYSQSQYKSLPLSTNQEFISKGQWVWGSEMDPKLTHENFASLYDQSDLFNLVDQLIGTTEQLVYISNAYITHQSSVLSDYEMFKERYTLELYKTGCSRACDVYLIKQPLPISN